MACALPLPAGLLSAAGVIGRSQGVEVPNAFNSLTAWSQALESRDEMYTFAPFVTNPSEIMRPTPFAPPVTRTTLPYKFC